VFVLTALGIGCTQEAREEVQGPIAFDSSGVRVVENGPALTASWRTGTEPLFTIGWDEGGPLLTWPKSGRILPDGGALVGEAAEGRIYRLAPDGSVTETFGRKGEGPGEYEVLDAIVLKGDTILVSDGRLGRVTVLSPDGNVGTTRLPEAGLHQASAIMPDGRLLLVPVDGYGGGTENRPEWVFETQPILSQDLEGAGADTLANLPHIRRWYGTRGATPGPLPSKGRAGGFSRGFAWARSDEREVRWYDAAGRLEQVARWEEAPAPLMEEWRDEMRKAYVSAYVSRGVEESFVAARLAELEQGLDLHEGPLPFWDQLHVDRMGNVWLSRLTPLAPTPEQWRVVDRDGELRGWISLPGVVAVLDITEDRILAVRLNELEVPAVTMLELLKP